MKDEELTDELSCKMYEAPLVARLDGAIADTSDPVNVLMLLINLRTEYEMGGMTTYIGNSSGLFIRETVDALNKIGCASEAKLLGEIIVVASRAGVTHDAIQKDRSSLKEFAITTFAKLHGDKWDDAAARIEELAEEIYESDQVWESMDRFAIENRDAILPFIT